MRISAAFPSNYIKAADLQGRRVKLKISHVAMEDIGGEHKPILYFRGADKGLVLNKTNSNAISFAYGDETDDWQGCEVELFEAMVDFQGRVVAAVRLSVPRQKPAVTAPVQAPARPAQNGHSPNADAFSTATGAGAVVDDEIPF